MEIIKYKNSQNNFISAQDAFELGNYCKVFSENDMVIKEEYFFEGQLMGAHLYNISETHQTIIKDQQSFGYKWINIVETILYKNNYKLFTRKNYEIDGTFTGTNLHLENALGQTVAYGYKNSNGDYEYDGIRKYYYDSKINPEDELFECTFKDNGDLWELYWNNFHIDDDGQESFVLLNNASDFQRLRDLTGMSEELARYYMNSEIKPDFKL